MIRHGGNAEIVGRQVVDEGRRGPGAIGGQGVEVEINPVHCVELEGWQGFCLSGDLVSRSAGRVRHVMILQEAQARRESAKAESN